MRQSDHQHARIAKHLEQIARCDVLPWIRTSASMISDLREDWHEQEHAPRRTSMMPFTARSVCAT
jgi:hypothetical protein